MRKQIALGVALALGVGAQAMAAEGLSYSYVQAGYANADWDLAGVTLSGFSLGGSVAFGERFFGSLDYLDVSKNGGHLKPLSLGVGLHLPMGMSVDFVSAASFESLKVTGADSESGWGLSAGVRAVVGSAVELHGGLKYVDFGSGADDMTFNIGGRYNFTETLSAGVDLTKWDDLDMTQWGITLRYSF